MIVVRPATAQDEAGIISILTAADLHYSGERLTGFTVAADGGKIVGVVRLEEHPAFYFLTSLGVLPAREKQGIASTLLRAVLNKKNKPVYLYTIIPDFFQPFGFAATAPLSALPAKELYGCEQCFPDQCVTMVRRA